MTLRIPGNVQKKMMLELGPLSTCSIKFIIVPYTLSSCKQYHISGCSQGAGEEPYLCSPPPLSDDP